MPENKEDQAWYFKCPNPKCGRTERVVQPIVDEVCDG